MTPACSRRRRLPGAALPLLLLALLTAASAQNLRGRITDADGQPLPGANIAVVGSDRGTVADARGEYRLTLPATGTVRLRASLVGYLGATSPAVEAMPGERTVDLVLRRQPVEMDPTVVAASAVGEAVRRAPNRVTIVDRDDLERAAARNVQEVLQSVEGLYISRGEGLLVTFPQIIVRGMSTGYLGRSTAALTMLNGHAINGSLGSWANVGDLDAIPLELVQKTEVIKGPYASTYGSGATGGVINVLTRKHFDRPVGGSVQLRVGPYGYRSLTPVAFGQGERLSWATWGELLAGGERETRRRSTWVDTTAGYLAEGRVEHSKYGFLLGYDISDRDRVDVLANRLEKRNNYNGRPISVESIDGSLVHVTFRRQLDDAHDLTVLGDWLHTDYSGRGDATPVHPDSADAVTRVQTWPNRELGMKAVIAGDLGAHAYAAGVEWRRTVNERVSWYGNRDILEFDVTGTQDILSLFAEDKIRLGTVEITPGVRVEQWRDNALYSRQGEDIEDLNGDGTKDRPHVGYRGGRDSREAVNPKLGVAWFASDALKLRVSAGSTFRAPRITETYSPDYQTLSYLLYRSNLDLKEERILSYEAGVDYVDEARGWSASVTAFYVDARDRIEFTFLGGFTAEDPFVIEHRNFDQAIPGVEGELTWQPLAGVGLAVNASAVRPEYDGGPFDGNTPPGVPDHTVNAHVDWQAAPGLDLRLAAQRIGTIWDDNANTVTRDDAGAITDTAELDPYGLVHLTARYELPLGPLESCYVDAELTNLLDADYDIYANRVWDYQPLGRALHVAVGTRF